MRKVDAIQKFNNSLNLELNNSNRHFANINNAQVLGKNIWWTEVPTRKFSNGFYLLFCHEDCYRFYVCSDRGDSQYMHDLIGKGQVDLINFILGNYE